ncbi:MAG: alpha/beta fold hydrolase [Isosphaeraceae bacterium]|nr:alpha/beta fold hydrolase [Isosphaeraceae bacterium]
MRVLWLGLLVFGANPLAIARADDVAVAIPRESSGDVDLAEIVVRLARATETNVERPGASLPLRVDGVAGTLTKKMLAANLGSDVAIGVGPQALTITIPRTRLDAAHRDDWRERLSRLALSIDEAARRRLKYGMRGLKSYRPNDPARPTICLVHGVNSSSAGFVHMVPPLEAAGFGIVVYDYPYNRSLEESGAAFRRDWKAFRRDARETHPWAIVAHSMGALVARSYVEDPREFDHDVSHLILIAPVNQGSNLAQAQTLMQLLKGVRATNGQTPSGGLAHLADGLGEAAEDMRPRSAFLAALNSRPRTPGVDYHILAGDVGVLTLVMRKQIEDQVDMARRDRGLLGNLTRAATGDLAARLDELTTGAGDGCVSVANTRLDGVKDHLTIHANHAELIRAPLLFADPGPVACMPYLLRWLGTAPAEAAKSR